MSGVTLTHEVTMRAWLALILVLWVAPAWAQAPVHAEVRARAEAGDPRAQTVAGVMAVHGAGTPADPAAGAADAGYAPARALLGTLYLAGRGVARDEHRAAVLFDQAAELAEARFNLGAMIHAGRGFIVDARGDVPMTDPATGEVITVPAAARRAVGRMTMLSAAMNGGLSVPAGPRLAALARDGDGAAALDAMTLVIPFDELAPATLDSPFLADALGR